MSKRARTTQKPGRSSTRLKGSLNTANIVSLQVPLAEQQRFVELQNAGAVGDCLTLGKHLTARYPQAAFAWNALGSAQLRSGQLKEAEQSLNTAQSLKPEDPAAHHNLGCLYWKQGLVEEGDEAMRRSLDCKGDYEPALTALTQRWRNAGKYREALELFDVALALRPNATGWSKSKAATLMRLGRFTEATAVLEELYKLLPNDAEVLDGLGNGYYNLGRFREGEAALARSMELAPESFQIHSDRMLLMHYNPELSAETIRDAHLEWDRKFRPQHVQRAEAADRNPDRRIRVGMLSAGFRIHPVGQMITSALKFLPREDIELFIYSMNDKVDAYTQVIQSRADSWQSVALLTDEDLDRQIRSDQIDILIDLSGHTEGNRTMVMAMEPVPLLIKWVGGQINTTGIKAMDYMLTDSIETPPGVDDDYLEKLIRLPDDYVCYVPRSDMPPVGPLPALENGFITFACFNNPAKINPELIGQWAALMHRLPGSRLFLKGAQYDSEELVGRFTQLFETRGITADRLIFETRSPQVQLLDCYNRVDIALDSWPYSGGLTTCEALLMGVPVVTLPGPTFAGRHSATHLTHAGLPELVVDSWEALQQVVLDMSADLPGLAERRRGLRTQLLQSPVCDPHRFARNLNIALRAIWQRYCAGKAPAALTFSDDAIARFEDEAQPVSVTINELPNPRAARRQDNVPEFDWALPRQIVAIDCGGRLVGDAGFEALLASGAFAVIGLDPASAVPDRARFEGDPNIQLLPHAILGNGEAAMLNACLDPAMSSVLTPLPGEQLNADLAIGATVITRLPISTIALDSIEGIEHIDWLLLDERCDALAVLRHGEKALGSTLLLQVRVLNQRRYGDQPALHEVIGWAHNHGFSLYRMDGAEYGQACREPVDGLRPTQLVALDLLFIPSPERLSQLAMDERRLLACLLKTVHRIVDLPYQLLNAADPEVGAQFLAAARPPPSDGAQTQAARVQRPQAEAHRAAAQEKGIVLPDAPHMNDAERALFRRALGQAHSYFEFGAGGSTVWAIQHGLEVRGVESDPAWVCALRDKLGETCLLEAVDIGPTGDWGFPVSDSAADRFPNYSLAIDSHDRNFDLILVDGRFRVACVMRAILHLAGRRDSDPEGRLFIHDFWNRPQYHVVLDFLEELDRADSAGLFRVRKDVDLRVVQATWEQYARNPG